MKFIFSCCAISKSTDNFWSVHSCHINCFIDGYRAVMRSGKSPSCADDSLEKNSQQDKAESLSCSSVFSLRFGRLSSTNQRFITPRGLPDVERRSTSGKTHCHHRPLPIFPSFPSIRSAPLNALSLYLRLNERRPSTMFIRK